MNNKTFWIGYGTIFVFMQVYNFLIHNVWLSETYEALAAAFRPREEMFGMMWMMVLGGLATMFLFCYIFMRGYEGKGILEGLRFGTLMGVFLSIPMAVDQYVVYPVTRELAGIWFATGVVGYIIAGGLFAAIYKREPERPHVTGEHELRGPPRP